MISFVVTLNIIGMKRLYTLRVSVDGVNKSVERGLCRKRMVLSCCKEEDDEIGSTLESFISVSSCTFSCISFLKFRLLNRLVFSL